MDGGDGSLILLPEDFEDAELEFAEAVGGVLGHGEFEDRSSEREDGLLVVTTALILLG